MNNYDDIINHPAWEPRYRKRMSPAARAAQFAPFAALSGHKETLDDTARRTQTQIDNAGSYDLSEDVRAGFTIKKC